MQVEGGYKYPGGAVFASILTIAAVVTVWVIAKLPLGRGVATLLVSEGTVLWASSFTPKGLVPPSPTLRGRLTWFFNQPAGVTFALNQPMFYLGVVLVIVGTIVGSCAS